MGNNRNKRRKLNTKRRKPNIKRKHRNRQHINTKNELNKQPIHRNNKRRTNSKTNRHKIDSNTKIKLTGNSYITSLEDEDTTYSNIDFNEYTLYVNGTAIN